MRVMPESTNAAYAGPALPWCVLGLLGALNLGRGGIHLFASDGGAGRIAGIDLSQGGDVIVFLFAVMGLHQIAFGAIDLLVALRYRSFLPLLLGLETLKACASALVIWVYKPLATPAPGKYGTLIAFPILALALVVCVRARERTGAQGLPARAAPLRVDGRTG